MSKPARPGGCPCGSKYSYAQCCKPLHEGAPAVDAEALMRSRYSAYALSMVSYLLRSWDESTRPALREADFEPATRWLGLRIVAPEVDPEDADRTSVVQGKGVAVRLDLGGSRIHKKQKKKQYQ